MILFWLLLVTPLTPFPAHLRLLCGWVSLANFPHCILKPRSSKWRKFSPRNILKSTFKSDYMATEEFPLRTSFSAVDPVSKTLKVHLSPHFFPFNCIQLLPIKFHDSYIYGGRLQFAGLDFVLFSFCFLFFKTISVQPRLDLNSKHSSCLSIPCMHEPPKLASSLHFKAKICLHPLNIFPLDSTCPSKCHFAALSQ